ncbi:MAG: DNA translocase FtsK [Lachnospiraceae bacterium]|nr:DNA translocase FtsK [Lachnospiraceae bacterium]
MRREVWLLLALAVAAILALSNFGVCGAFGRIVSDVMFGIFGFMAYIFPFYLFISTAFLISNGYSRKAVIKFASATILYLLICLMLEMLFMNYEDGKTLRDYYEAGSTLHKGGGFAGGALELVLRPLLGTAGAYILAVAGMIVSLVLITEKSVIKGVKNGSTHLYETAKEDAMKAREESRIRQEEKRLKKEQRVDKKVRGVVLAELDEQPQGSEIAAADCDKKTSDTAQERKTLHEITMEYKDAAIFGEEAVQEQSYEAVQEKTPVIEKSVSEEQPSAEEPCIVTEQPMTVQKADREEVKSFEPEFASVQMPEEIVDYTVDVKGIESDFGMEQQAPPAPVYHFPPIELLTKGKSAGTNGRSAELAETAKKLQQTLQNFGVGVTVTDVSCGPSVTRYELQPEQGVKVSKIVALADDIKLNLAAADIRIEAPIPGKAAVGIEVPNKENATVMLRDLLESEEFKKHPSKLAFAAGKDIGGQTIVADIAKMPHLLIAGATGSGKSVCINTLIMSILYKAKPDEVKLIMIDPKVVELSVYNGIPHLMIPVVTDPKKAAGALNWAVAEMTDRYNKFSDLNVRDLKGYNEKVDSIKDIEEEGKPARLPQIVIIVDELADLMMVASGEVEDAICRLAQLARAAGIHLVIATQRPSVNVITGLIKANVPSRIAFSVSSGVDSRTIIDMNGAEKLLGKGDMLFYPAGYQKPARVQGAFVSDKEVGAVVDFLVKQTSETQYNEEVNNKITNTINLDAVQGGAASDKDDYFAEAGRFIIEKEKASIGMLQRMFKIGFNRAARIMDQLAEAGVVGPEEGTKPRKILMTMEEFEEYIQGK